MSKVDNKIILYILTVIDYMAADILKVLLSYSSFPFQCYWFLSLFII